MVDRGRFARGAHICEENGPADPVLQGVVSDWKLLAESGGDLDREQTSVAADNLRSYVRDSDPYKYWDEGCQLASYTIWLL
jgi:hypothetical protein